MNKFAKEYISQFETYILEQVNYISSNPWNLKTNRKDLKKEESLQKTLAESALTKLVYFLQKVDREERNQYKRIQKFVELLASPSLLYINTCEEYLAANRDWISYDNYEKKALEISFQDELLTNINTFRRKLSELNVDNSVGDLNIPIFADKVIPFMMKEAMESKYPEILEYIEEHKP